MIHAAGQNGRPLCMGGPDLAYDGHYVYHLVPDPAQADCPECQAEAEREPEPEPEVEPVTTHQADENGRPTCGFRPARGERVRVAPGLEQVNCPACSPSSEDTSEEAETAVEDPLPFEPLPEDSEPESPEPEAEPPKTPRRRRGRPPAQPVEEDPAPREE